MSRANEITEYLVAEIALDITKIEPDTDLLLSGLVDSLGVIALVAHLEEEYSVTISPVDVTLENFQTVNNMTAYLDTLSGEEAAA